MARAAIKIRVGELMLSPSENEQNFALMGAGVLLLGLCTGSKVMAVAGAGFVAGVGLAVYEEARTFTDPELMNGYFRTGGALSATRGAEEAEVLRRRGYSRS